RLAEMLGGTFVVEESTRPVEQAMPARQAQLAVHVMLVELVIDDRVVQHRAVRGRAETQIHVAPAGDRGQVDRIRNAEDGLALYAAILERHGVAVAFSAFEDRAVVVRVAGDARARLER